MALAFPRTTGFWIIHVFFVFTLSRVTQPVTAEGTGPWCEAIADGGSATVTCHFPHDVYSSDLEFSLEHRKVHSLEENPVVSCIWPNKTTIQCECEPGYKFNKKLSDSIKVEIATPTYQHDGQYTCKVIPYDGKSSLPCTLNVSGVPDPPSHIRIENATLESITMCWKAPSNNGEQLSYRIQYRLANSEEQYVIVNVWPRDATCFMIAGLTPGNGYEVSIQAGNKFGWSSYRDLPDIANTSALVTAQTEPAADSCGNTFQILFGITFGILVIAAVSALLYHWHSRRKQTTSDDETGPKKEEQEKAIDPDKKGNTYCSIQEDGGLQGQSPTRPEKNHPRQRNTDRRKEHTYENVLQRTQGVGDNKMQIEEDTDNPERTQDGDDDKEADCSKQALLDLEPAQH